MKINAGVIGLGDGGAWNIKSLLALGVNVAATCDIDTTRLKWVESLGVEAPFYEDYRTLLGNVSIELVVIALPDNLHLEATQAALEKGKIVFLEKPVATDLNDIEKFKKLNEQYPDKILFGEKYSFAHPVQIALLLKESLGELMTGSTSYTMGSCDRIMGDGKWRTEHAYNPCAGGLSHNFMTMLLFSDSPIARIFATGQVLAYKELEKHGGFDTMRGILEFANGIQIGWEICLATRGPNSPFSHRTVTHCLQFKNGNLVYAPDPESDKLILNGESRSSKPEAAQDVWPDYNLMLYERMHIDVLSALRGDQPLHNIDQGINVARACALAFQSAKQGGVWLEI